MKSIKNILGAASMMTLALSATSCTDGNDWDVDGSLSRLFGVNSDKLTVETTETTATVTFAAYTSKEVAEAEYYVFELSKDSLYEGVENANIVTFGEDKSLTTSPVVLTGLDNDSKYYMRVKSISSTTNESKWVYYKKGQSFKTKAEQIFNEVSASDLFDDHVRLTWTAGAEVTHITVVQTDNGAKKQLDLSEEIKAQGRAVVSGLTGNTTYLITIYNGSVKRGQLTITTPAPMPAADYKVTLGADVTEINQDLIDEIADQAKAAAGSETNYSATIGIKADATLDFGSVVIPEGMSVTFFGIAGGEAPTLKFTKALGIDGSHSFIKFQNVNLVDNGAAYFINQKNACTIGELSMEDCKVDNFKTTVFRMQKGGTMTISNLVLINSIFTKCGSGYAFIHADANKAGKFDNIKIDKCTFNTICATGKHFIYSKETPTTSIAISNSTFYNVNGGGQFFIDFNKDTIGPNSLSILNCIFSKQPDEATNKNIRCSATPEIAGCYNTNDWFKAFTGLTALEYSSTDLFTDPANGDFTIKKGTLTEKAGDPRWYPTED